MESLIQGDLIIKQVNTTKTNFKNVFSTNVFIPREFNLSHKSFSYFTGFVNGEPSPFISILICLLYMVKISLDDDLIAFNPVFNNSNLFMSLSNY